MVSISSVPPVHTLSDRPPRPDRVSSGPEATFARHETFAPRYGWLKKGFEAIRSDGAVFSYEDAAIRLGVGKNMARAIRYWILACGVVEEAPNKALRAGAILRPTQFGEA